MKEYGRKRAISMLLAAALLLTQLPFSAWATENVEGNSAQPVQQAAPSETEEGEDSAPQEPAFYVGSGSSGARSATTSAGDVWLGGTYMEVGVAKNGSFGTSSQAPSSPTFHAMGGGKGLGMVSSHDGVNWNVLTTDYFMPGTVDESLSIGWNGVMQFVICDNGTTGGRVRPADGKTEDLSTGDTLKAKTTFTQQGVEYTQVVQFNKDDKFFTTTITVKNTTSSDMSGFRYMRAFDPDQRSRGDLGASSTNNVVGNAELNPYGTSVIAYGLNDTSTTPFIFFSPDKRAVAGYTTSGLNFNDLFNNNGKMVTQTGRSLFSDNDIFIYCDFGDLKAGASDTFTYYSSLDTDISSALDGMLSANKDNFVSGRGDGSTDTPSVNKYYITILKTDDSNQYALYDSSGQVVPNCDWLDGDNGKRVYGPFDGGEEYAVKIRLKSNPSGKQIEMGPFDCPVIADTYTLTGTVFTQSEAALLPADNVLVQAMNGNIEFTRTTTDAAGAFRLTNMQAGKYNLVFTDAATGKVLTNAVNSTGDLDVGNIIFLDQTESTELEVKNGAPNTVVTNLDSLLKNETPSGKARTILMTVDSASDASEGGAFLQTLLANDNKNGSLFLSLSLEQKTVDLITADTEITPISQTGTLLEIAIELPDEAASKKNYVVYRHHDYNGDGQAQAEEIDKITRIPNANGEYFTVQGNKLTLYTKYFSTYAIGYDELSYLQPAPSVSVDYEGEKLTGYTDAMEYSLDGGATYHTDENLAQSLSSLIPAAGEKGFVLKVRIKGNELKGVTESAPVSITLPARPVAPVLQIEQVENNKVQLKAVSGAVYAFKLVQDASFSPYTESPLFENLSELTNYQFQARIKAGEGRFASAVSNSLQVCTPRSSRWQFHIAASVGAGGSISPSAGAYVRMDESAGFAVIPNDGYEIEQVWVNGKPVGAVAWYEFHHVLSNQTISATFKKAGFVAESPSGSSSQEGASSSNKSDDTDRFLRILNDLQKSDVSYEWLPDIQANKEEVQELVSLANLLSKDAYESLSEKDRNDALSYANALQQCASLPEITMEELFAQAFKAPATDPAPDEVSKEPETIEKPAANETEETASEGSSRCYWWLLLLLVPAVWYWWVKRNREKE